MKQCSKDAPKQMLQTAPGIIEFRPLWCELLHFILNKNGGSGGGPPGIDHGDGHCSVSVLDEALRLMTGECWPNFIDIALEESIGRVGTRVTVRGLKSKKLEHFNNLNGTKEVHTEHTGRRVCSCCEPAVPPPFPPSSFLGPLFLLPLSRYWHWILQVRSGDWGMAG